MVRANFRLRFFGERTHIFVRARTHHLYGLAIDRTICIHFVSTKTRGKKSCLNPVHKYIPNLSDIFTVHTDTDDDDDTDTDTF